MSDRRGRPQRARSQLLRTISSEASTGPFGRRIAHPTLIRPTKALQKSGTMTVFRETGHDPGPSLFSNADFDAQLARERAHEAIAFITDIRLRGPPLRGPVRPSTGGGVGVREK
jgi:hypothetical protein